MLKRTVTFYRTASGYCPLEDFLNSLPSKVADKITWVLRLIAQLEAVPIQYFCKMDGTDGIWECRIKLGSNIYRIFAFWDGPELILTHGFIKKTQKTPPREIERAQRHKKEHFQRKG